MFSLRRSGRAKKGKFLKLIRFAKEITEYVNAMPTRPPVSFQVYTDISPGTNSAQIFIQKQFSYQPTRDQHELRDRLNQRKFQSEGVVLLRT